MQGLGAVRTLAAALAFAAPWAVFGLVEQAVLGRCHFCTANDGLTSYFGHGLNILMGMWPGPTHHPGIITQELAALAVWIAGPDGSPESVARMLTAGLALHLLQAVAAGVLVAASLRDEGARPAHCLGLGLVAAACPPVLANSSHLAPYADFGIWAVPLATAIRAGFSASPRAPTQMAVGFALLGFLAAILYLIAPLAVPLAAYAVAAWMRQSCPALMVIQAPPARPALAATLAVALLAGSALTAAACAFVLGHDPRYFLTALLRGHGAGEWVWLSVIAGGGLGTALAAAAAEAWSPRLRPLLRRVVIPGLGGWLAGANLAAPEWLYAGLSATASRPLGDRDWSQLGVLLRDYPWMLIPLAALLLAWRRSAAQPLLAWVGVPALGLMLWIGLGKFEADLPFPDYGLAPRYFIAAIPVAVWVLSVPAGRALALLRLALVATVLVIEVGAWWGNARQVITESRALDRKFAEAEAEFFRRHPDGLVFCLADSALGATCNLSYAYNRSLGATSSGVRSLVWTHGGRVRFVPMGAIEAGPVPTASLLDGRQGSAVLVIGARSAMARLLPRAQFDGRGVLAEQDGLEAAVLPLR